MNSNSNISNISKAKPTKSSDQSVLLGRKRQSTRTAVLKHSKSETETERLIDARIKIHEELEKFYQWNPSTDLEKVANKELKKHLKPGQRCNYSMITLRAFAKMGILGTRVPVNAVLPTINSVVPNGELKLEGTGPAITCEICATEPLMIIYLECGHHTCGVCHDRMESGNGQGIKKCFICRGFNAPLVALDRNGPKYEFNHSVTNRYNNLKERRLNCVKAEVVTLTQNNLELGRQVETLLESTVKLTNEKEVLLFHNKNLLEDYKKTTQEKEALVLQHRNVTEDLVRMTDMNNVLEQRNEALNRSLMRRVAESQKMENENEELQRRVTSITNEKNLSDITKEIVRDRLNRALEEKSVLESKNAELIVTMREITDTIDINALD